MAKVIYTNVAIREGTVLPKGDGSVLCYSKEGGYYYSVSLKDILTAYDEKDKARDKKVEDCISEMKKQMSEMTEKYNEMVKTMKETMSSMISMVESSSTSK